MFVLSQNKMLSANMVLTGQSLIAYNNFCNVVANKRGLIVGTYVNNETKILIQCDKGHTWEAEPHSIKKGSWCLKCSGRCPIQAREDFYRIVDEKDGIVLGTYINTTSKVLIQCGEGHQWETTPRNVKTRRWCPKCGGTSCGQGRETFYRILNEKGGIALNDYTNNRTKVLIQCNKGHQWETTPSCIKIGTWCPECSGVTPEQARDKFYNIIHERGGIALSEYVNSTTKVLVQCEKGHRWYTTSTNIGNNRWCPTCNMSKGELMVRTFLIHNQIPFEEQYTIPELPRKKYDFYAFYNNRYFLIEYDGKQHFEYADYFHKTPNSFEENRQVDILKHTTGKQLGYVMIRIDYKSLDQIWEHLMKAFLSPSNEYLSNPVMYRFLNTT